MKKISSGIRSRDLQTRLQAINEAVAGDMRNTEIIESLISALKYKQPEGWLAAGEALEKLAGPEAVPVLIKKLESSNPKIIEICAELLGLLRAENAVEKLTLLLKDKRNMVRANVAESLGRIGCKESVPHLLEVLDDSDFIVQGLAVDALGWIGETSVKDRLNDMKSMTDNDWLNLHLSNTLYLLGDKTQYDNIRKHLFEGEWAAPAAQMIGYIGLDFPEHERAELRDELEKYRESLNAADYSGVIECLGEAIDRLRGIRK
ncbi:MAG: HEAT repeat domain-containing protein [Firmicutes bacterium]|nr:HEAT repeat domain-containing protein [Bacillota bacterium]